MTMPWLERRQLFLEEIAAAAQGTIKRVTANGMILRIDQSFDRKRAGFHLKVESLVDGKRYDFSVGRTVSSSAWTSLDRAPAA